MLTKVSAASDGVLHAERVQGQGQAIRYYLGGPNHSRRHSGDLHGPLSTMKQPPPHLVPANAAAWATTDCNVAGHSTKTPTAGRPPHNHPPTALPAYTQPDYRHHDPPKRPCRHRQRHDRPNGEPADHAATCIARRQPSCYRTNTRLQTDHTQTSQNRT